MTKSALNHCPLCTSDRIRYLAALPANEPFYPPFLTKDLRANFYTCKSCDLIFRSPSPDPDSLFKYYRDQYPKNESRAKETLRISKKKMQEAESKRYKEARYSLLKFCNNGPGYIVDFGGGTGSSLEPWIETGWRGSVIELRRLNSTAIAPIASDTHPDIITSYHCLEHIADIKSILCQLKGLIKKGTIMCLEVPAEILVVKGFIKKRSPIINPNNEHLNFFSPRSLRKLAKLMGLKVLGISIIVTEHWSGPLVSFRLYAKNTGELESENLFSIPFAIQILIWKTIASFKFRLYRLGKFFRSFYHCSIPQS